MSATVESLLIDKVNLAIDQLRPFLHADGGDMELVDITADYVVRVRSRSTMTLKAGLEDAIRAAAPEVKAVVAVDELEIL